MAQVADEIPTVGTVQLPPDPRIMDAIGGNHGFETAVADLVDNSLDAGANRVLLRFVLRAGHALRFVVADNGRGILADKIDKAMTVGGGRDYDPTDLGHFGWGLKAASLSQADSLTLLSRAERSRAVGRRWTARGARTDFGCDEVDEVFAAATLKEVLPHVGGPSTVVRWDEVRAFPRAEDPDVTTAWLSDQLPRLATHLGLVFHRFLQDGRLDVRMDVLDEEYGGGPPTKVEALDPFGYGQTGHPAYPRTLHASLGAVPLDLACHIWPGRAQQPAFRLQGRRGEEHQGFYFYRRQRLLQAGGWNGVEVRRRELQLGRIAVELDDRSIAAGEFRMNPEKSRVEVGPAFARAVEQGTFNDGGTWGGFLEDCRAANKQARSRTFTRSKVIPPGRGFAPGVRKAINDELEFISNEDPLDIRWERLPEDVFFEIDRDNRTVWLNKRYRWAVVGDGSTSLNDAPLVKALLYLLTENLFQGAYLGSRDKDNLELWQSILITAAKAQAR